VGRQLVGGGGGCTSSLLSTSFSCSHECSCAVLAAQQYSVVVRERDDAGGQFIHTRIIKNSSGGVCVCVCVCTTGEHTETHAEGDTVRHVEEAHDVSAVLQQCALRYCSARALHCFVQPPCWLLFGLCRLIVCYAD
jgi:hypothetical protein